MDETKRKAKAVTKWGSLLAVLSWALYSLDWDKVLAFFSESLGHEYFKITLIFAIATVIHRRGMRKDMASVTDAINSLGDALRDDLRALGKEIGVVKDEQKQMNSRIIVLEQTKKE